MIDLLNGFFTSTFAYSKFFYVVRLLAVMSLAGIGLGLAARLWSPERGKKVKNRLP